MDRGIRAICWVREDVATGFHGGVEMGFVLRGGRGRSGKEGRRVSRRWTSGKLFANCLNCLHRYKGNLYRRATFAQQTVKCCWSVTSKGLLVYLDVSTENVRQHFDPSISPCVERFGERFFASPRERRDQFSERHGAKTKSVIRNRTRGGKRRRYREGGPGQQVGNFQAQLNSYKLGDASQQWERTDGWSVLSVVCTVRSFGANFSIKTKPEARRGGRERKKIGTGRQLACHYDAECAPTRRLPFSDCARSTWEFPCSAREINL